MYISNQRKYTCKNCVTLPKDLEPNFFYYSCVRLLNKNLDDSKDKIYILENKVFCQEVQLNELKDSHSKKINSYNVKIENLKTQCRNNNSLNKDSLKMKNDLEVTSKILET